MARSKVTYKEVDIRKAVVYQASILSKKRQKEEGICDFMPMGKALSNRGRESTIRAKELVGPIARWLVKEAIEEEKEDFLEYLEDREVIGSKLDKPEAG